MRWYATTRSFASIIGGAPWYGSESCAGAVLGERPSASGGTNTPRTLTPKLPPATSVTAAVAQTLPNSCRTISQAAHIRPNFFDLGQFLVSSGQIWPTLGPDRPNLVECPNLAKFGQTLAQSDQLWSNFANILPSLTNFWPNSANVGRVFPSLGQIVSRLTTLWPKSTSLGLIWAEARFLEQLLDNCSATLRHLLRTRDGRRTRWGTLSRRRGEQFVRNLWAPLLSPPFSAFPGRHHHKATAHSRIGNRLVGWSKCKLDSFDALLIAKV